MAMSSFMVDDFVDPDFVEEFDAGTPPAIVATRRTYGPIYLLRIFSGFFPGGELRFCYNHPEGIIDDEYYRPIILSIGNIQQSLNDGTGAFGTRVIPTFGQFQFDLDGGKNDDLCAYAWLDLEYHLLQGPYDVNRRNFTNYTLVARGRTRNASWTWDRFTLSISDESEQFKDIPSVRTYIGNGLSTDGSVELAGKPKPRLLGLVLPLTPVLTHPSQSIYQYNTESGTASGVAEAGIALNFAGDTSTLGLFVIGDWDQIPGSYITDNANGLIRLGAPAQGRISMTAFDATRNTPIGILTEMMNRYAPSIPRNLFVIDQLDINNNYNSGIYLDSDNTQPLIEILDYLVASINAYWTFTILGIFEVREVAFGVSQGILIDDDFAPRTVQRTSGTRPVWRVRMHYRNVQNPFRPSEVSPLVTDPNLLALLTTEWRVFEYIDDAIKTQYRDALSIDAYSVVFTPNDAETVAQKIGVLRGAVREVYSSTILNREFEFKLGDTWTINSSRFGLNRDMIIIGINERIGDRATDIEWWG